MIRSILTLSFILCVTALLADKASAQQPAFHRTVLEKTVRIVEGSGAGPISSPAVPVSSRKATPDRTTLRSFSAGAELPSPEMGKSQSEIFAGMNLSTYQPPGWGDRIIVYKHKTNYTAIPTSMYDESTMYTSDSLYVAFAIVSNGTDPINVRFYVKLYIDGVESLSGYLDNIQAGYYWAFWDQYVNKTLTAGSHTFTLTVDATGTVAETNESDNSYSKFTTFYDGITITSPAGGENWASGTVQTITYSAPNSSTIDILWKRTTDASWTPVATDYPANAGSYRWVTREAAGSDALIQVRDASDTTLQKVSNAFLIDVAKTADANWTLQYSNATYSLVSIKAVDASTAFVIGNSASSAIVLRTTDGGANWTNATGNLSTSNLLYAVEAQSSTVAWVGDELGHVLKTTNGGSTWTQMTTIGTFVDGIKLVGTSLVVVSDNSPVLAISRSTDGGTNWTPSTVPTNLSVTYSYPNNMEVVGNTVFTGTNDGKLLKSTDSGVNWSYASNGLSSIGGISFADASNGILVNGGAYYNVWKSTTGGASGTLVLNLVPHAFGADLLKSTSPYVGWIVGARGMILKTTDGGTNWSQQFAGTTQSINAVDFVSTSAGWVVTQSGSIFRYGSTVAAVPSISSFTPTSGPVGTSVTITGTNFGATQGTSTVKFGTTSATPTSWSTSQIVVPVPSGLTAGSSYAINVTVGANTATSATSFSVTATPAPTITSFTPTSGPVGTSVTVTGTNFGATQGTSTVKFGTASATPTSWSATQIVAPVPSGLSVGSIIKIAVTVGTNTATSSSSFTVTTTPTTPVISLSATTLSFGSVSAGSTSKQTLTINNIGGSTLTGTASVTSNAGFTISKTSYNIAAGGKDSIIVTFAPTAAQNYNATLTLTHNATGSPSTVTLAGTGQASTSTPSITLSRSSVLILNNGTSLSFDPVDIVVTNNGGAALTGTVTFTGISFLSVNTGILNVAANGGTQTIRLSRSALSATVSTYTGTLTFVHNASGGLSTVSVTAKVVTIPATVNVSTTVSFKDVDKPESYQLFSVPGQDTRSPDKVLSGEYKKDWRMYRDNGAVTNFLVEYDESSAFNFGPGKGFWILSRNGASVSGTATGATPTSGAYSIALANGWNIISNPFDRTVNWTDVKAYNNLAANASIYRWSSGSWSSSSVLVPFQAYYYNNTTSAASLKIPYDPAGALAKSDEEGADEPFIAETNCRISVSSEGRTASSAYAAFDEHAGDDYDQEDYIAPPSSFASLNVQIENRGLSIPYKRLYVEHRTEVGAGQTFDLVVLNKTQDVAQLTFDGIVHFTGHEVYLNDVRHSVMYDLKKYSSIPVPPSPDEQRYQLLIGGKQYVEQAGTASVPNDYTLYQNYPNPFNPTTTIGYVVPDRAHVTLTVYDVMGKAVMMLVNATQPAGYYAVTVNGDRLSTGVYYYRLTAGTFTDTRKMILMK